MKTIEAYQCSSCRTKRYIKAAMERHELKCPKRKRKERAAYKGVVKIKKKFNYDKAALEIWSELVKVIAGYKSEYSGKEENLISHHVYGKTGRAHCLRYDLANGICITAGEHSFKAHGSKSEQDAFFDWWSRRNDSCAEKCERAMHWTREKGDVRLHFYRLRGLYMSTQHRDTPASRRIDKLIEEEKQK